MKHTHLQNTIPLADLVDVLRFARLRRLTAGRTCQLCALTQAPLIRVDCADGHPSHWVIAEARQRGIARHVACPMRRGHIARLMERVQRQQGRREVLKTWGVGIRALLAEPKYTLNGGAR